MSGSSIVLSHPLPGGRPTASYGWRGAVAGLPAQLHTGQDWAAEAGTPILAAAPGVVSNRGFEVGGYGNYVYINHGDGQITRYAHMRNPSPLAIGTSVARGQAIGLVGTTGASTGNHLHFELRLNGSAVDPMPYIGGNPPAPKPPVQTDEESEEQMRAIYYKSGKTFYVLVFNSVSGFAHEYNTNDPAYNNKIAAGWGTGNFTDVSQSHYNRVKADLEAVRKGK